MGGRGREGGTEGAREDVRWLSKRQIDGRGIEGEAEGGVGRRRVDRGTQGRERRDLPIWLCVARGTRGPIKK